MRTIATLLLSGLGTLSGCTDRSPAPVDPPSTATTAAPASSIPAALFVAEPPSGGQPLVTVKSSARSGDEVVLVARIGGRKAPFVEGRAMFQVVDSAVPACDQEACDDCPTPWDYCCEPQEHLLRNSATVRVTGPDGTIIATSLQGMHGLEPLRTVTVRGVVSQRDDQGATFVVDAREIHVQ